MSHNLSMDVAKNAAPLPTPLKSVDMRNTLEIRIPGPMSNLPFYATIRIQVFTQDHSVHDQP